MCTSRSEYRLLLREDNADVRLTPLGRELGLVDEERWRFFNDKCEAVEREASRLHATLLRAGAVPDEWQQRVLGSALARDVIGFDLLRRPEVDYAALVELAGPAPDAAHLDPRIAEQRELELVVRARYAGYIERQHEEIEKARAHETAPLPGDLDYAQVSGLSNEVRQRLAEVRPLTLGQAARVPGVTPAAVSLLMIHMKRSRAVGT
jgi:tRNA uridine 5-carboxymethylaminomethyl modification enzyme